MSFRILGKTVVLALLLPFPPLLAGYIWTCEAGGFTRKIVVDASYTARLPCKIVYKKPTEKEPDVVLSDATRDPELCADKAEALALELRSKRWSCRLD